jgi:hypothetical protein
VTKKEFIAAYREYVSGNYPWAVNETKLDRFMRSVTETLTTDNTPWAWDGPSSKAVWKRLGGKGKLTLKGLRELP